MEMIDVPLWALIGKLNPDIAFPDRATQDESFYLKVPDVKSKKVRYSKCFTIGCGEEECGLGGFSG